MNFINLITRMLAYKEEDRFTLDDVINSEWFNETYDENKAIESIRSKLLTMR